MNVARIMQEPVRVGSLPVAICNEAIAISKDVFVATGSIWVLATRLMAGATAWPTERAYAAAASDYVKDARRVIDALRDASGDDDAYGDPLAGGWDDVVRRPLAVRAISRFGSLPFEEGHERRASSA